MAVSKKLRDRVYARCEEQGECRIWKGATQRNGSSPSMNWKGRVRAVRRLLLESSVGLPPVGKQASYTCGNKRCVTLAHLAYLDRSEIRARCHADMTAGVRRVRSIRICAAVRGKRKLDHEKVEAIRTAEGTQRQRADRFGVSQATVSTIDRGETWRDHNNIFGGLAP